MIVYTMPKSRIMSAGTVGTSKRIRVNGPEGGGDKLQGLPPICNMRSPLVPYVRTRADGENRNVVFCINQLSGGVGAKRGQFGPGNRAGVGQTGGCAAPAMSTGQAYAILQNYFKGLNVVLVGIYETVQGDLGGHHKSSLQSYGDIQHYASFTTEHNAKNNYDGISDPQVRKAIDVLNSLEYYAAAIMVGNGGSNMLVEQRHIVGTATTPSIEALGSKGYGKSLRLTDNKVLLALGYKDAPSASTGLLRNEGEFPSDPSDLIRKEIDDQFRLAVHVGGTAEEALELTLDAYRDKNSFTTITDYTTARSGPDDSDPSTTRPFVDGCSSKHPTHRYFSVFKTFRANDLVTPDPASVKHWIQLNYVPHGASNSIRQWILVENTDALGDPNADEFNKIWTTSSAVGVPGALYYSEEVIEDTVILRLAQQLELTIKQPRWSSCGSDGDNAGWWGAHVDGVEDDEDAKYKAYGWLSQRLNNCGVENRPCVGRNNKPCKC